MPDLDEEIFKPGKYRMGDMFNLTLRAGLDADPRRIVFGEDVEDPKGGVFTLTKHLSTDFPGQVFNSPLAESTILGVACGLASYGWRPVFELQFIDFIYPGWNQLVTNLATLRWRTFGKWTCPAVIYAPYGAYLPGGSLWHSQANEASIAHFPGLNVVIPSTPEDAVGLLWTAMHGDDPTLVLVPKHMLWAEREVKQAISAVPIGAARRLTEGTEVTVVAWGNTVEKAMEADGPARRRGERRADRPAFDRPLGPGAGRGIRPQDRAPRGRAGGHGELQRRPDDHFAPCRPARRLEPAGEPASSGLKGQRDDRLQPGLRVRRPARRHPHHRGRAPRTSPGPSRREPRRPPPPGRRPARPGRKSRLPPRRRPAQNPHPSTSRSKSR
jgi:pyruvate/2-oxoglutarate/acetoin dehydrogenase E1 component